MKAYRNVLFLAAVVIGSAVTAAAQGRLLSPPKTASVTIDGKKITIGYGAPSARGRRVMGYLVPFGEVWCTGANDATSLVSEADLDIAGLKVPRGSYTLWTVPNRTEWMLVINKQTGQWHTEYDQSQDLGRVKIHVKSLASPVETLRIDLTPAGAREGTLAVNWETTQAWTNFTVVR